MSAKTKDEELVRLLGAQFQLSDDDEDDEDEEDGDGDFCLNFDDDDDYMAPRINATERVKQSNEKAKEIEAEHAKKLEQAKQKRDQTRLRRIRYSPPGLKVFRQPYFVYFKQKCLSLEKDFGYQQRPFLKEKCKLSDAQIDEIFNTPWKFVMYLSPSSTSPLIRTENDFGQIADFLFFSYVSTKTHRVAAILKKALFTLLKNYGYTSWKLSLRHILPAFLNMGMEEAAVLNKEIYYKILKYRLEKFLEENVSMSFDINDHLPEFFETRRKSDELVEEDDSTDDEKNEKLSYVCSDDEDVKRDEAKADEDFKWSPTKYTVMRRIISIISDLICTFPNLSSFVACEARKENWIQSLVAFYILGTVLTDWHLIMDSSISCNLSNAFRVMLDGFSRDCWLCSEEATENSVSIDITEALVKIGNFPSVKNHRTWFQNEVPQTLRDVDHLDNICRRIETLPQTSRGNIIRKMMAHDALQIVIGKEDKKVTRAFANVEEAAEIVQNNKQVLQHYHKEYYVMWSVVRLLDVMVGNEPFLDFTNDRFEKYVKVIQDYLEHMKSTKMSMSGGGLTNADMHKLSELISQTIIKWKLLRTSCQEGKQKLDCNKKKSKK